MAALLIAGGLERFRCEEWLLRCQHSPTAIAVWCNGRSTRAWSAWAKPRNSVRLYGMVSPGAFAHPTAFGDFYGDHGSALRWRIGRPGVSADAAATMALASMP